jgi:CheY-like chemotaxis protein
MSDEGKIQLGNKPVNIKLLAEKLVTQFSGPVEAKGLGFTTYIHPDLDIELMTDETIVCQVVSNLLSNAVKFTANGSINLTVNKLMASGTTVTVQFIVKDTGIGITPDKQKEIFESFAQAHIETSNKHEGIGLGLTTTKGLLKLFSSELIIQSEEGTGSKFLFDLELSISGNKKPNIDEVKSGSLQQLAGIRVLVAEDNPINMAVVKRCLTKWGIDTIVAVNGKEAVEKFEPGKYDLLLLDLEMPEMDGASALKEIRKFDLRVPIVAFTAAIYENIQMDLKEKGFSDFLHKPFHPEDLHSKIYSLAVENKRA